MRIGILVNIDIGLLINLTSIGIGITVALNMYFR